MEKKDDDGINCLGYKLIDLTKLSTMNVTVTTTVTVTIWQYDH